MKVKIKKIESTLKIIVNSITNSIAIITLFVAASILAHKPELGFGIKWLVIMEVIVLIALGFILLSANIIITAHKFKDVEVNKWLFGILGGLFFAIYIHAAGALSVQSIKASLSAFSTTTLEAPVNK